MGQPRLRRSGIRHDEVSCREQSRWRVDRRRLPLPRRHPLPRRRQADRPLQKLLPPDTRRGRRRRPDFREAKLRHVGDVELRLPGAGEPERREQRLPLQLFPGHRQQRGNPRLFQERLRPIRLCDGHHGLRCEDGAVLRGRRAAHVRHGLPPVRHRGLAQRQRLWSGQRRRRRHGGIRRHPEKRRRSSATATPTPRATSGRWASRTSSSPSRTARTSRRRRPPASHTTWKVRTPSLQAALRASDTAFTSPTRAAAGLSRNPLPKASATPTFPALRRTRSCSNGASCSHSC